MAFGITVPKALGDFLVLDAVYKTDGCAVAVDDSEILRAEEMIASREGTFICPEGAATLSAAIKLVDTGWIKAFEPADWMAPLTGGDPVDFEAEQTLIADLLSAASLGFDGEGDLYVGGGDLYGGGAR